MSEHDEKAEEHVEDLDVPESESEDVKGGLLPKVEQPGLQQGFKPGLKLNKGQIAGKWEGPAGRFGDGSV